MPEFHIIFARKISKLPELVWYLPEKLKFSNFAWFLLENARILRNNCPKNIFSWILWGGVPPLPPPSHTPMVSFSFQLFTHNSETSSLDLDILFSRHICRCHVMQSLRLYDNPSFTVDALSLAFLQLFGLCFFLFFWTRQRVPNDCELLVSIFSIFVPCRILK